MANLFTLGFGKVSDLMGKLADADFTAEMAEEVRKNPALAKIMVNALKQQPAFTLVHGLFIKPEAQIVRVRELNLERKWGFTDEDFLQVEKSIPKWPADKLVVVTLVPYLDDEKKGRKSVERTFHELWEVAASAQHAKCRWDGYDKAGPDTLRLLKEIEHKPGLRWEVIDLGCNRNEKPMDVRNPEKKSPHAGILASAMLHPEWIKAMDGDTVPYVWAPGYEVQVPGNEPWACVPCLRFDRGRHEIRLDDGWYCHASLQWAVPSFFRE